MKRSNPISSFLVVATTVLLAWAATTTSEPATTSSATNAPQLSSGERLFIDKVGPIFRNKCAQCHTSGDPQEGGLELSSRIALLKGGDSGPAIVPGEPDDSRLYQAVQRTDPDTKMPPEDSERLSAEEVAAIHDWIAAGAPWPDVKPTAAVKVELTGSAVAWNSGESLEGRAMPTSGGLSPEWTMRKYTAADVWAYLPVKRYAPPRILAADGKALHPIDAFLRDKQTQKKLTPAGPAEPAVWLRRATFDLTGLPPTPDEIEAFTKGNAPNYAAAIDRLLASPHYGEQMARHWLDVVRYADTSGFSNDYERPHAWRYRDYVVRSFNADKPYDRFVIEQIAGDELDANDPELLIAVGFLRMGPWEHTGMSVAAETRQAFLDDVTHSVGQTFLGQGLRCARCHDHKFDPVPTRDYYRIQACFAPVQFLDRQVPFLPTENTQGPAPGKPRTEQMLAEAQATTAKLKAKRDEAAAAWLKQNGYKSIEDVPDDKRPGMFFGLTSYEMTQRKLAQKREAYYQLEMRRYEPEAISVYNGPNVIFDMVAGRPQSGNMGKRNSGSGKKTPAAFAGKAVEPVFILAGGSLASPGDRVSPGVLSACFGSSDEHQPSAWNTVPQGLNGRRLALARWIASDQNPLTARVIVNRIWQMHFGRGLVATPNNFGKMGAKPTHPELLDWLAVWFMEHDWSVKKLHRLIMSSAAYRQASSHPQFEEIAAVDAKNDLLSYFPVRRLAAEELRDAALAATGELNRTVGGPAVFPEINWETALQPRHIMGSVAPAYQPSPQPSDRHRRTLYAFQCRTLGDPMLEVFNKPTSDLSCERRDETTVTPQVFALFNGQAAHDRALALAARLVKDHADDDKRLDAACLVLYGRKSTAEERTLASEHVAQLTAHHERNPPEPSRPPEIVKRVYVEELTGESVEWEEKLDLMSTFVSDLKPWQVDAATRAWGELCLVLMNANEFVYVR